MLKWLATSSSRRGILQAPRGALCATGWHSPSASGPPNCTAGNDLCRGNLEQAEQCYRCVIRSKDAACHATLGYVLY